MVDVPPVEISEVSVEGSRDGDPLVVLRFHADGAPVVSRDRHGPGWHVAMALDIKSWRRIVAEVERLTAERQVMLRRSDWRPKGT